MMAVEMHFFDAAVAVRVGVEDHPWRGEVDSERRRDVDAFGRILVGGVEEWVQDVAQDAVLEVEQIEQRAVEERARRARNAGHVFAIDDQVRVPGQRHGLDRLRVAFEPQVDRQMQAAVLEDLLDQRREFVEPARE